MPAGHRTAKGHNTQVSRSPLDAGPWTGKPAVHHTAHIKRQCGQQLTKRTVTGHEGQQGTTHHRTRTRRPARHHTAQDQVTQVSRDAKTQDQDMQASRDAQSTGTGTWSPEGHGTAQDKNTQASTGTTQHRTRTLCPTGYHMAQNKVTQVSSGPHGTGTG